MKILKRHIGCFASVIWIDAPIETGIILEVNGKTANLFFPLRKKEFIQQTVDFAQIKAIGKSITSLLKYSGLSKINTSEDTSKIYVNTTRILDGDGSVKKPYNLQQFNSLTIFPKTVYINGIPGTYKKLQPKPIYNVLK